MEIWGDDCEIAWIEVRRIVLASGVSGSKMTRWASVIVCILQASLCLPGCMTDSISEQRNLLDFATR